MTNRTALLCAVGVALVAATGCSQSGPGAGNSNAGGSTSTAGTTTSSGGSGDSGGAASSNTDTQAGGSQTSGGASSGNGGTQNTETTATGAGGQTETTGGTTGAGTTAVATGGKSTTASAAGGATGVGGATVGTGGSAPKGGATGAGGTTAAATGGTKAATGGALATGGASAAATGGAPPATGGAAAITAATIVPDLAAGFYWEASCQGSIAVTGHNCPMADTCPSTGVDRQVVKNVAGTTGQTYTVTIEVRGVIGTRCYKNGTRASTTAGSDTGNNNWWYVGGVYDNPTGWWNSYELHVAPTTGDASGDVYYFNGSDVGSGTWCEKEATYLVKYTASFKVKGGGTLTFKIHDQNCKAQQNCGSNIDPNSTCAPRTVDLSGMTPQPPSTFKQPPTNNISTGTFDPQWMYIVATSVTSP